VRSYDLHLVFFSFILLSGILLLYFMFRRLLFRIIKNGVCLASTYIFPFLPLGIIRVILRKVLRIISWILVWWLSIIVTVIWTCPIFYRPLCIPTLIYLFLFNHFIRIWKFLFLALIVYCKTLTIVFLLLLLLNYLLSFLLFFSFKLLQFFFQFFLITNCLNISKSILFRELLWIKRSIFCVVVVNFIIKIVLNFFLLLLIWLNRFIVGFLILLIFLHFVFI
jgi:hypothetical protein